MKKLAVIWFLWVMSVVFFAWAAHFSPVTDDIRFPFTAPEFFMFALGVVHLFAGFIVFVKLNTTWTDYNHSHLGKLLSDD